MGSLLTHIPPQVWQDIAAAIVTAVGAWATAYVQKTKRGANLALVIQVATKCAIDAEKSWQPGQTRQQVIAAAVAAAKIDLARAMPELDKALEAEAENLLDLLIHGAAAKTVTTPGGSTVTMPSPVTSPGA